MNRLLACLLCTLIPCVHADGERDNHPEKVRPIPPPGVEIPAEKKAKLEAALAELKSSIDALQKNARVRDLLPDVEIFYRAAHDGLAYREFLDPKEIDQALQLIEIGKRRAADLAEGKAPWTTQTGLVVRGYVSAIDGSVQPYGLSIPDSYTFTGSARYRLDFWFHGRSETLTEGNFVSQRMKSRDAIAVYAPRDTIVLFPYGRYCNAAKLAGEIDALEALADTQKRYRIDAERISVRGFSMGGASAWHFAVHYADRWFAANPGAGFAETPRFLDVFQKEKLNPMPWEKKLWAMYDCDKWALNLAQCPTVVYSGEIDSQKQAGDLMEEALKADGIDMVHIIAPKTAHKIIPAQAQEVEARMEALARDGRRRVPRSVAFETYTLKYNRMNWVTVDSLSEHWARAEVRAALAEPSRVNVRTSKVTDLTFSMDAGDCPLDVTAPVTISIDGQELANSPRPRSDRSWNVSLHREANTWKLGARPNANAETLRKRHDLQGPIDDAFLSAFIFVKPTGQAANEFAAKWTASEFEHAVAQWRSQFRGHAIIKDDTAVTPDDIATKNLIIWGDPSSNAVLKKIADKLPIRWDAKIITAGAKQFDAANHAAILIHPNPLNPARYVVLNSGFTYREYAYLNNARQVPMLPDWVIVDLREPANNVWPGKIPAAGFFDENWRVKE